MTRSEYQKAWRLANPDKSAAHSAAWREKNKSYAANYYIKNKEKMNSQAMASHMANKAKRNAASKKYHAEHKTEAKARARAFYAANKSSLLAASKLYRSTPKGRFAKYKNTAKAKGIAFSLSFEQFVEFWQKPCSYCGCTIDTIGLDRADNSVGYELGNIVPCCSRCNYFKLGMGREEFIALCARIAANTACR